MSTRTVIALLTLLLLPLSVARADYYYYGVANDDFTGDNDTLWDALEEYPEWHSSRADLQDNRLGYYTTTPQRDSIYEDLSWYADNLSSGDVFMFAYMGHGGWGNIELSPADEGSTRPEENDPAPTTTAPYQYDEFFGWVAGASSWQDYMFDDDFVNAFASFDADVEVVVISGACHSGGWVGGSSDMDTSAPANNNGLYAILGAPEQATAIGLGSGGSYEILLTRALVESLEPYMTMSSWYTSAMEYGQTHQRYVNTSWADPAWYYYWPAADWTPTPYEATYHTDHWGWQETYLQLRPEEYAAVDAAHDYMMGTPEPATTTVLVVGLLGMAARLRRRRAG